MMVTRPPKPPPRPPGGVREYWTDTPPPMAGYIPHAPDPAFVRPPSSSWEECREAVGAWWIKTRLGRSWERHFRTDPIGLLENLEAEADRLLWEADPEFAASLGGERVKP